MSQAYRGLDNVSIRERLARNGELTLDELCVDFAGRGVIVHRSSVGRLLHRLGLSHKKPDGK
ncbi:winged helix-turn-helix domain-containing protein [Pararhizobium sp. BT-229]|uniref:winged helix-turn-helix domain-containing protein n=1 Tax=Pararhizobium sp. BT-229 TaxID=2986923 RepID=UPI0021F7A851|nr:winged helix-turn-helix domain-containing protein [Pararhizobium sp. BT-229]MCV9967049.1 winged helix-turn-helix domain-containing protein [Pararhizobium sp. BT-229]